MTMLPLMTLPPFVRHFDHAPVLNAVICRFKPFFSLTGVVRAAGGDLVDRDGGPIDDGVCVTGLCGATKCISQFLGASTT